MLSLDDKQRRELWGLGLFALALLLALSLVPLAAFGEGATRIFASQNIVGVAGKALSDALTGFMGVAAVALPVLAALLSTLTLALARNRRRAAVPAKAVAGA